MLEILKERKIGDIQADFNAMFPFLKLDFYAPWSSIRAEREKKALFPNNRITETGLTRPGKIEIVKGMTVAQLVQAFVSSFGIRVQISRMSGEVWLPTLMTGNWTLESQNRHGEEISVIRALQVT